MNIDNTYSILTFLEGLIAGIVSVKLTDLVVGAFHRQQVKALSARREEQKRAAEKFLSSFDRMVNEAKRVRIETERVRRDAEALVKVSDNAPHS